MVKNILLFIVLILIGISFIFIPHFREISAGIAILLFGMISLENGFKSFAEGPLKKILSHATDKFYKSFSIGMLSTAILQSSSLISVITISFLSAGLLSLHQGIGIIFGANLGTTATAWLVATLGLKLNISALAVPMIVFGIVLYLQSKRTLKGIGNILAGLGFFFFGIAIMKEGFDAYQDSFDLTSFSAESISGQMIFLLIGILLTVILQSSSASMAIILTALATGQISYLNAMSLAIGANVGTTITALIGAIASNIDGKRIAAAHLLFNIITGLVAFIFLRALGNVVDFLAESINLAQDNFTMKLAIFHTLFNTIGILIMLPLVFPMEKILMVLIKTKKYSQNNPKFINESSLAFPQTSLEVLIKETNHLFDICFEAIAHGLGLSRTTMLNKDEMKKTSASGDIVYDHTNIDEIYYNRIKNVYGEIVKFGTKAQDKFSDARFIKAINDILEANRYFVEVVKDIKDLQPNVLLYCDSENDLIRNEYNKYRKRIAKFIRMVFSYQQFEIPETASDQNNEEIINRINHEREILEKYLEKSKSKDILHNGSLSQLILDKKINEKMVTSLINDSRIVYSISKHLIKAAELLYLNTDVILADSAEE
jgi:phosphate:Na+ symporter